MTLFHILSYFHLVSPKLEAKGFSFTLKGSEPLIGHIDERKQHFPTTHGGRFNVTPPRFIFRSFCDTSRILDFWMIFHWFAGIQGLNFCSDCHLMQLGTISFFSLLLLLHLLLCLHLNRWEFLTEWRKWVKPLTCLPHSTLQIFFTILLILLKHSLHAWLIWCLKVPLDLLLQA